MKNYLPKVLVSSVIRSSQKGESHGGIYLVDLETEKVSQVFDWNSPSISWEGRGGERGLRGITFYKDQIYLADTKELYCFNQDFKIIASFRNPYLKYTHEICVDQDKLYLTSTAFDSILVFDLFQKCFVEGFCFRRKKTNVWRRGVNKLARIFRYSLPLNINFQMYAYDLFGEDGPSEKDSIHLNNVTLSDEGICFSGTGLEQLIQIKNKQFKAINTIPRGTHNVQFFHQHLLYNDTPNDRISLIEKDQAKHYVIKQYMEKELTNFGIPKDYARQAFGRGLSTWGDYIIGGSSPATISVYHVEKRDAIKVINLSKDIRNAIHGLEIWPY